MKEALDAKNTDTVTNKGRCVFCNDCCFPQKFTAVILEIGQNFWIGLWTRNEFKEL